MDNLIHADCLDAMAAMDAESIDAIVTDPPYGLEFMGKEWDKLRNPSAHPLDQKRGMTFGEPEKGNPWASERSSYGAPKKNPRCRKCHRLRFSEAASKCQCAEPDWDTRTAEYAQTMQSWHEAWAREAFRVAKPGAHLLAFGGTRTVHRLAAAIEDAGWEIRDMLVWGYASGFPKSLDVSKAIDRAAGAEREVVGKRDRYLDGHDRQNLGDRNEVYGQGLTANGVADITAPATPDAEKWNGWGTALKPAWEPIVMARKPLRGTVAANVLRHGTGALNIDGTRIGTTVETWPVSRRYTSDGNAPVVSRDHDGVTQSAGDAPAGRWPANVILTDPIFDGGIDGVVGGGETTSGKAAANGHVRAATLHDTASGWAMRHDADAGELYGDSGTYSRFFLIAKSARAEREPVLGGLPTSLGKIGNHGNLSAGDDLSTKLGTNKPRANVHPTVKPLDLMRHLVRLVTPPGGVVLDPFLGSGTTALAAEMEGFAWVGIEKEAEYIAITEARLNGTQRGLGLVG